MVTPGGRIQLAQEVARNRFTNLVTAFGMPFTTA
jgi:hypothetical protein